MAVGLDDLKKKLILANHILEFQETTNNVGRGHQSVLLPDRRHILIPGHIHGRGGGLAQMTVDDLVTIDSHGRLVEGGLEPMQEYPIHTCIYRARPDVGSVIHIHPFWAGVLALANVPIAPISKDGCLFADGVTILDRFPLFIGDDEIGTAAADALGTRKALLHRGHGAIVVGRTIEEATITAVFLERAAKAQWHAMAIGHPVAFNERAAAGYLDAGRHDCDEVFQYFSARLAERRAASSR
jgi:L-fuculose-phosphate aldolase